MTRTCVIAIVFLGACGGAAGVAEPPAPARIIAVHRAPPAPELPHVAAVVEDVAGDVDHCPEEIEGVDDYDSCPDVVVVIVDPPTPPDVDDDGEGIPDSIDRCPDVPDPNDDDGCPDPVPAADGVLERAGA